MVIIIALMCLGLLALNKVRVNQIPNVDQPVMVVTIPYPGASPESVEREILNRVDPSAQPIMQLALSSTTQSHAEISRLAEDMAADCFRSIDGVAVVYVNGSLRRELSVLVAGMTPAAIGLGEGGEFYRPMAVATHRARVGGVATGA